MKMSEIYTALEAGRLLSGDEAFVALVAIEYLAGLQGVPVAALDFTAPKFARAYPPDQKGLPNHWNSVIGYAAFRRTILNVQMQASPSDTDDNPWRSLLRAHRLGTGRAPRSVLFDLEHNVPVGTQPRDITTDLILSIAETVAANDLPRLRMDVYVFINLFDSDLARQTGLLPSNPPKPIPEPRDHFNHAPMSPEIQAFRSKLEKPATVRAINYVNRLTVTGGVLNGRSDTLEDLRKSLIRLPSAAALGIPERTPKVLDQHLNNIINALGGKDPRLSEVQQAWTDLRASARAADCETSFLWALWKPAIAKGLKPQHITQEIALEFVNSYRNSSMPAQCRRGCEQFDALHGVLSPDFLPREPLGISRTQKKQRQPPLPRQPRSSFHQAWKKLFDEIRRGNLIDDGFQALSFIKIRAIDDNLLPHEITQSWVEHHRTTCALHNRSRLYTAIKQLSHLTHLGVPKLKPLQALNARHGGVPITLKNELGALFEEMGLATISRRQMSLAVGILRERVDGPNQDKLSSLLDMDVAAVDWGTTEGQSKAHIAKILSLRAFRDLPWTDAWRRLQKEVVASGMTALHNPVPKILSWRSEMEPYELNAAWARKVDAELRSAKFNPPYGQATRAYTLSRHLAGIDALHEIPAVVGTGLLPPIIGDYRKGRPEDPK